MPPLSHLAAFALTALVIIAIPGPSVLFTVSRALTLGRRGAFLTVLGNAIGQALQVVAVAFGIGTIVERSATVYTTLKLAGAAYLIYLGIRAFRHRHALRDVLAAVTVPRERTRRVVADGLLVGVTNPKSIVLFVAALPQFIDAGSGHPTLQLLVLGAVFPVLALACDSVWAVTAGSARAWLIRSPRRVSAVGGAAGVTMIGIGASLAISGRRD